MDLSPLARERLERIGKLSPEEEQKLEYERQTDELLASFFADKSSVDDVWQDVKAASDKRGEGIITQAQLRLLDAIRLNTSDSDFVRYRDALLALETLKGSRSYSTVEMLLGSIASVRQRHAEMRQQAYQQLRQQLDQQIRAQSEQARRQGLMMDTEASIEASIKATPEWRDFISRHDASATQALEDYVSRIRDTLRAQG